MGTTTEATSPHRLAPAIDSFPSSAPPERTSLPRRRGRRLRRKAAHGAWRQLVLCRAEWIRHEAEQAARRNPSGDAGDAGHVLELLDTSRRVANKPGGLITWFEGCQQERAWLTLHEAEAELIELLTGEELRAHAQDVMRKAYRLLGPQDQRVQSVASALDDCAVVPDERLAPRAAHLARATFEALDDRYAQSRGFRNRLIRITVIALLGVAALVVATSVGHLRLGPPSGPSDIPAGWETSLLVTLFGVVGGIVSAVPPLARAQGSRNPFSLPVFQCLLKLVMGPLFAFVGLLLMQTQVVSGFEPVHSLMKLALWATLFGAGQQSVTHFIDQRLTGMLTVAADPEPPPKHPKKVTGPGGPPRAAAPPPPHTPAANGQHDAGARDVHAS